MKKINEFDEKNTLVFEVENKTSNPIEEVDVLAVGKKISGDIDISDISDSSHYCKKIRIECIGAPNREIRMRSCGQKVLIGDTKTCFYEIYPLINIEQTDPFYRDLDIDYNIKKPIVFCDDCRFVVSLIPPKTTMRYYFVLNDKIESEKLVRFNNKISQELPQTILAEVVGGFNSNATNFQVLHLHTTNKYDRISTSGTYYYDDNGDEIPFSVIKRFVSVCDVEQKMQNTEDFLRSLLLKLK